jgi:hypothetical protein
MIDDGVAFDRRAAGSKALDDLLISRPARDAVRASLSVQRAA